MASALVTGSLGLLGASQAAANCVDTDGDGWGWDGSDTCDPHADSADDGFSSGGGSDQDSASSSRADDEFSFGGDSDHAPAGESAECVDSDGDGWGWTGAASCLMPSNSSASIEVHSPTDNEWSFDSSTDVYDVGEVQLDESYDWASSFEVPVDSDDASAVEPNDPFNRPTSFDLVNDPNGSVAVILANYTPDISAENAVDVVAAMEAGHDTDDAAIGDELNSMPRDTIVQNDARLRAIHQYNLDQANEQISTYSQAEAVLRADGQRDQADLMAGRLADAEALVSSSSEGLYPTNVSEALAAHIFGSPVTLAQVSLVHREESWLSGYDGIMPGSSSPTDRAGNPISIGQQAANIYNGGVPGGGEFANTPVVRVEPTPAPVREHQSLADENTTNSNHSYSGQDAANEWANGNNDTGEFG